MAMVARITVSFALALFLCSVGSAQVVRPNPTPPPTPDEDFGCGLLIREPTKIRVTVWNPKAKMFVNDLDHKDFEVFVAGEFREIDYFSKPGAGLENKELSNTYIIGLMLSDWYRPGWYRLKLKVKPSKIPREIEVKAPRRVYVEH